MSTHVNKDYETYSDCNLKKKGAWVYAEDPSTELLCMSYNVDSSVVVSVDPRDPSTLPDFITTPGMLAKPSMIKHAWNAPFEYAITKHCLGVDPGEWDTWVDTMAIARANGLPGALKDCGRAMRLTDDLIKSDTGAALITYLCVPYKGNRRYDEDRLQKLMAYCDQDVVTESAIFDLLPPMTDRERQVWLLDMKINERGIPIDVANAEHAVAMFAEVKEKNRTALCRICGVDNPGSGPEMKDFFEREGLTLPNLQAATLDKLLRDSDDLPPKVQEMMPYYQAYKRSPITKYQGMVDRASRDGRMRGAMLYHGGHTGRWSSTGINTQNLPRPNVGNANDLIGQFSFRDIDYLVEQAEDFYGEPMTTDATSVLASAIRGMICAENGKRLIVNDWDQIEARIIGWLAQEESIIDVFRKGLDPYKAQAAKMFNKSVENVTGDERFLGKIGVLALGFGGSVGAFKKMAEAYGRDDLPDSVVKPVVNSFRQSNKGITDLWVHIEQAALEAVNFKGKVCNVGSHGFLKFRCSPKPPYCLQMRLPSGRCLHYWYPKVVAGKFGGPQIQYEGTDSETRQWKPIQGWYGQLTENAVQAIAADYLRDALINLDDAGYNIVLHVHDEIVCEEPWGRGSVEEMSEIICREPAWFKGMPVAASGDEMIRFSK